METSEVLEVFADGCFKPGSGHGGWAFVAYRDLLEIASDFGGVQDSANTDGAYRPSSDSVYAIEGYSRPS